MTRSSLALFLAAVSCASTGAALRGTGVQQAASPGTRHIYMSWRHSMSWSTPGRKARPSRRRSTSRRHAQESRSAPGPSSPGPPARSSRITVADPRRPPQQPSPGRLAGRPKGRVFFVERTGRAMRSRTIAGLIILGAACTGWAVTLRASDPVGVYAVVEKIVLEPSRCRPAARADLGRVLDGRPQRCGHLRAGAARLPLLLVPAGAGQRLPERVGGSARPSRARTRASDSAAATRTSGGSASSTRRSPRPTRIPSSSASCA